MTAAPPVGDEAVLHRAISENIMAQLRYLDLTQSDLARAIGLSPTTVSYRLFGKNRWKIIDLYRAADFFGCRLSELFPPLSEVDPGDPDHITRYAAGA